MQFIFFNAAGRPLFVRSDAEQATWTVETLSMVAAFPYDADKVITRAMRIAFEDELGVLHPFEIRKVETMEPDHYQRLTCEHIAISELTDRHMDAQELTNVTAQAALTGILTGTGWVVGNVTATGTSSADLALGSVWQNVRTIEASWNVYITPRVTFNTSGITGRYLDIAPAQGTWRGIRLSLDKNADEMGVVIDDTEVKTALFGYGASTDGVPLTFAAAVWQQTAEHPAKPAGQTYIEDPAATAAYGRNGEARFGFYQNADITDAQTLLEKTWEALKSTNAPRVTINCMVRDLYRLGYADQPIRLHDIAMVQIRQTNTNLQLEITQLTVDLLDPTATRPTIGAYIPNIVYIQRDTGREASGGASNTLSGRRGGGGSGGKSAKENQLSEFETEIKQNQYQISLRAYQRDVNNMENILKEAGVAIDAGGVIIYAGNNLTQMKSAIQVNADGITAEVTNRQNADQALSSRITQTADAITAEVTRAEGAESALSSRLTITADAITTEVTNRENADQALSSQITQNANQIALKVNKGNVSTQLAIECGNVTVSGGNLVVSGYITSQGLITAMGSFSGPIVAPSVTADAFYLGRSSGEQLVQKEISMGTLHFTNSFVVGTGTSGQLDIGHYHEVTFSDGKFTIGGATGTAPDPFDITATTWYKNKIAAAKNDRSVKASSFLITNVTEYPNSKMILFSVEAIANDGTIYTSATQSLTYTGESYTQVISGYSHYGALYSYDSVDGYQRVGTGYWYLSGTRYNALYAKD